MDGHCYLHRCVRWPGVRWLLLAASLILAASLDVEQAHAASFAVTTANDEGQLSPVGGSCTNTPSGQCSLRAAVQAANAQGGGPHTIVLAGGTTYTLTVLGQGENAAATGDLDVTASIAIVSMAGGATIEAGADAASAIDRVFDVQTGGNLTLTGLTVRHGNGGSAGGGAINNLGTLSLRNATVRNSQGTGRGGGILSGPSSILTVENSTIRDNIALGSSAGGGIASTGVFNAPSATVTIVASTISGNSASNGGGMYALYTVGTITNTTLSGNAATSSGGGILADVAGDITILNVTMTANSAANAGGMSAANTGRIRPRNSIVAGNTTRDCFGDVVSQGYNLFGDMSFCSITGDTTGNSTGQNPLLGALQDNGGFTLTHALGGGSPAIDAGNPADCTDASSDLLATDQRGVSRSSGGRCDIGAYEVGGGGPVVAAIADQTVLEDTATVPLPLLFADSDTAAASASFTVTVLSSNTTVIPQAHVVLAGTGGSRHIVVTPAADANGASTVTLNVRDAANNQVDKPFVVTVTPVNDPPSFTPGPTVTALEDSGPQSVAWATALARGPADESGQHLSFVIVGNSNPALFAAGPAIATDGVLTFTPAANTAGSAQIAVQLTDDGGTANGGSNTSAPVNFTISVAAINDPPTVTLPSAAPDYAAGSAAVVVDAAALVTDIDSPNLDGGQLTAQIASGAAAGDQLEIRDNPGPDPVDVDGNALVVGGVTVGGVSPGSGGTSLQVSLNADATPARVQAIVRNLTFRTAANAPVRARTIAVQVSDGDGGVSSVVNQTVTVTPPVPPPSPCASKPTVTRPNVRLQPVAGGGRLDVTVEAAPVDSQTNNPLVELRFGQFQNARVTFQGAPVAPGATVPLPNGVVSVTFSVERQTPRQPTHVPFTVVDSCGSWNTFVGGGVGADF